MSFSVSDGILCIHPTAVTALTFSRFDFTFKLAVGAVFEDNLGNDEKSQEMKRRFTALLAHRALAMHDRVLIFSQNTIRNKLMVFLTLMHSESGSDSFDIPFSRADMAAYFGVNRSALSRELTKMRREGLIDYYMNHFTILQKNS